MLKTILPDAARTPHQTKNQPLGTTPLRISSCLASSFIQLAKLTLSLAASTSSCSFNSGVIRILNCGDCPPPFGLRSRVVTVDKWPPIELMFTSLGGHLITVTPEKKAALNSAPTLPEPHHSRKLRATLWLHQSVPTSLPQSTAHSAKSAR